MTESALHRDYTTFRLAHATPNHLHATSTTLFIGPIPHSWVSTYEKKWYKKPRTNYHRKDLAFLRDDTVANTNHTFSNCARWRAESESVQVSRAATIQSERCFDVVPAQEALSPIREVSTSSQDHLSEPPHTSEPVDTIPIAPISSPVESVRPALAVHSPPFPNRFG